MANKKKKNTESGVKEDVQPEPRSEGGQQRWQVLDADGKLTWVSLCSIERVVVEQLVASAADNGVVRPGGSVVLVPADLCCKSDSSLRRLTKRVFAAAANRRVVWLPNLVYGCRVGLSYAVNRPIVLDAGDVQLCFAGDLIRVLAGDDYWAVWHGDKQIFCYHANTGEILSQVCKAVGRTMEYVGDGIQRTDEDWESLAGMPFSEFEQLCRDRKRAEVQKQIMQKERELLDLRSMLGPDTQEKD